MLMPAFHRFPDEAAIIGRILAGYGELEYLMAMCLGAAMSDELTAQRVLFQMKSERVKVADSLLEPLCRRARLLGPYSAAYGGMRHCAKIRNQYAHSNWADHIESGLFFVNLQESTKSHDSLNHEWRHVDVNLLTMQEDFLFNTMQWYDYLRDQFDLLNGKTRSAFFSPPSRPQQPPLYNPPESHIPPWIILNNDQQKETP